MIAESETMKNEALLEDVLERVALPSKFASSNNADESSFDVIAIYRFVIILRLCFIVNRFSFHYYCLKQHCIC